MNINTQPKYFAVIPAAGIGSRMQSDIPKQYLKLNDKTLLEHVLKVLLDYSQLEKIAVVLHAQDQYWSKLSLHNHPKIITVLGGKERCHSVYQGLLALKKQAQANDWVIVHDAARPFFQLSDLNKLLAAIKDHPVGGLLGTPVRDTLKRIDAQGAVQQTIERAQLWQAFTPQVFRYGVLNTALESAFAKQQPVTDEAAAVELLGLQPLMVQGRSDNIKITVPEDLL